MENHFPNPSGDVRHERYLILLQSITGHKLPHLKELRLVTINFSSIRIITYAFYIKQPMKTVEIFLKKNFEKNPHLTSALVESDSHPLIRKCSYNQWF